MGNPVYDDIKVTVILCLLRSVTLSQLRTGKWAEGLGAQGLGRKNPDSREIQINESIRKIKPSKANFSYLHTFVPSTCLFQMHLI